MQMDYNVETGIVHDTLPKFNNAPYYSFNYPAIDGL